MSFELSEASPLPFAHHTFCRPPCGFRHPAPSAFHLAASGFGVNPLAPRSLSPCGFCSRRTLKGRFAAALRFGFVEPTPFGTCSQLHRGTAAETSVLRAPSSFYGLVASSLLKSAPFGRNRACPLPPEPPLPACAFRFVSRFARQPVCDAAHLLFLARAFRLAPLDSVEPSPHGPAFAFPCGECSHLPSPVCPVPALTRSGFPSRALTSTGSLPACAFRSPGAPAHHSFGPARWHRFPFHACALPVLRSALCPRTSRSGAVSALCTPRSPSADSPAPTCTDGGRNERSRLLHRSCERRLCRAVPNSAPRSTLASGSLVRALGFQ